MKNGRSLRVGVIFGGRSGEHEVSLNSARNVMDALQRAGHTVIPLGITPAGHWLTGGDPLAQLSAAAALPDSALRADAQPSADEQPSWALLPHGAGASLPQLDVIFPVLHGTYGEDGTVQGLLEMANLPYVGCGVLASAVAMDKLVAKHLFAQAGLMQTPYLGVRRRRWRTAPDAVVQEVEAQLAYPLFVKPANLGSSVGISKAKDRTSLAAALDLAAGYDQKIVIEAAVANPREIEVSVLGNDAPQASVPGEIVPGNEFYDYEAKYVSDNSRLIIPARLDAATTASIQSMAIRAFQAVDASGLARVDFLMDDATGVIYLNEVNTMPGFTRISMYPKLWEASGLSYPALVDRLLDLALDQYAERQENSTVYRTVSPAGAP